MADGPRPKDVAADTVVAGTASLIGLLSSELAVASAAVAPAASAAVKGALEWVSGRQRQRQEHVFAFAASVAGLSVEELQRRCEKDADLEDLLLLVLAAATDTASRDKLIAYCLALASGVSMPDDQDRWQSALVRTIRELGPEHLVLLDRFTWTANRLGLGDGREDFNRVPEQLEDGQVEMVAGDIPALRSALATLQRLGLLAAQYPGAGMAFSGGGSSPISLWKLTDFGAQVLDLLRQIGDRLQASPRE